MQRGREEKFARRAAAEDAVSCFVWTLKNQPLSKAGTVVIHKQTTTTKKTWSWIICQLHLVELWKTFVLTAATEEAGHVLNIKMNQILHV